ncbi:hypothetical protein RU639_013583 [Aspergillus parasiticus]|uniref:Uncharacterized protein n=1 Tax=Aspergillus transmontanensis TaxID=1034304 RepID=A0A5N6VQT0_9EURO|nr:hypothetical protein BDV41DRAFT_356106 [Aspergillus transmontanensis]
MTTSKPSNQKRAFWRNKCRKALATHINKQLSLTIRPDKVRLRPRPDDEYRWSVADCMSKHFETDFSRWRLGDFQEICNVLELEKQDLIEAIRPRILPQIHSTLQNEHRLTSDQGFTSTIEQLKQKNQELVVRNEQLQKEGELKLRNAQQSLEAERKNLQGEVQQWRAATESYREQLKQASQIIMPALSTMSLHLSEMFDSK